MIGCLVCKPQFALVLPLLLLITGNWRAIVGAALSSLGLIAITYAVWGWPVWQAFLDSLPLTQKVVTGLDSGWAKDHEPLCGNPRLGGRLGIAYAVQGVASIAAIVATLWLARNARPDLRNAAVTAAVLISTPYVLDYDFVVLLAGLAFLWRDSKRHGWLPWDKTLLALVWIAPLVARNVAALTHIPLGLATAIIVIVIAVRRALRASPSRHSRAGSDQ